MPCLNICTGDLVEQYQRNVNSLDRDIAALEKKKAEADKKSADLSKKICSVQKSITPRTSASIAASKMKQISRWENERTRQSTESAELSKKIADKRSKRNDAYLKLQREQQQESKQQELKIKQMQRKYEERISQLQEMAMPSNINPNCDNESHEMEEEQFDVFVSHAWEDKESFVDEFVKELRKLDLKVWYDTSQLKWGDSMREKIDDGLRKSKFGVVVLSPDYIRDGKYWTKAELNGLFQLESINGKILLPIWHNLTKQEVINYSPIIANKKAMTTATMTSSEIAQELVKILE